MRTEAVLFDLDGTLINSMDLHYQCWCDILSMYAKTIDKTHFLRLEGAKIEELMASLLDHPDELNIKELIKVKDELFSKRFTFDLYPGVLELMSLLIQNDLSLGIVTASSRERFYRTIPSSFHDHFDCIVTGDDLPVGKPSPKVYLEGARRLNCSSDKTLVIENAPLGVRSAVDAGMRCMVVGNTLPRRDFPKNIEYFETNIELLKGIKYEFEKGGHNHREARSGS